MEDLKVIFAQNLIALRKQSRLTQAELAEKINYSDKAVSKWERGESIPDVAVLKCIAELFGVSIDFLVAQHDDKEVIAEQSNYAKKIKRKNRLFISVIPLIAIVLCATVVFVALQATAPSARNAVYCFVFPLPVCAILAFIFSAVWGNKMITMIFVSLFIWLLILDVFLIVGFFVKFYPLIFIIGIPAELVVMMSFRIIKIKK